MDASKILKLELVRVRELSRARENMDRQIVSIASNSLGCGLSELAVADAARATVQRDLIDTISMAMVRITERDAAGADAEAYMVQATDAVVAQAQAMLSRLIDRLSQLKGEVRDRAERIRREIVEAVEAQG